MLGIAASAGAAPEDAPAFDATRSDGGVQVSIDPNVWLARVRGNTTFGGPNFTVDDELGLNAYTAAINGEVSVEWGTFYEATLTGWYFSTSATTNATEAGAFGNATIALGDQLSNSFSASSVGGEFKATLWQPYADQQFPWGAFSPNASNIADDGGYKANLKFDVLAAVRWYGASLTVDDQTSATSGAWTLGATMPALGAGVSLDVDLHKRIPFVDSVSFEAYGAWGSNFINGQYFTSIKAAMTVNITPSVGVSFGYSLEDFKLNSNSANFDGGVQGLFLGATVKF